MNGLTVTRRGWIVLALAIVGFAVAVNVVMANRSIVCDWRTGFTPCAIQELTH